MKKYLNAVFALCMMLALVACEKAFVLEKDDEAQSGNLRVSVLQIEQTPFSRLMQGDAGAATRATQDVSEVCTRLNFAVYDTGGSRIKQVNQASSDKDFGSVSFQLNDGNYVLVVVGHDANGNPTMTNPEKISFTNAQGYTDTFLSASEVTIGSTPLDVEVTLDRIVALCRFVVTDDIPAGVAKMQFYYTGGSGAFSAYTGLGTVNSKQTVTYDVTSGQKQFDLYTFLHEQSGEISLKVSALDAAGSTLYERDFEVPMTRNNITWLSGAFFNASSSSSNRVTGVRVNTEWTGETHLSF